MGINISITNSKISDKAKVINNGTIKSNNSEVNLVIDNTEIVGEAQLLENLCIDDIDEIVNEVKEKDSLMDHTSKEYLELKRLIEHQNKETLYSEIKKHILNFSNGVLQQIVASYILMNK